MVYIKYGFLAYFVNGVPKFHLFIKKWDPYSFLIAMVFKPHY